LSPKADADPVWSPDGRHLLYGSQAGIAFGMFWKDTAGLKNPESLIPAGAGAHRADDWSRDGRWIIYTQSERDHRSIWALPVNPDGPAVAGKPIPVVQGEYSAQSGTLSPDTRWLAYASTESGRAEIYVRTFSPAAPAAGRKWQVSTQGTFGFRGAAWRRNGKELFYTAGDGKLMSVPIQTNPSFQAATPSTLFDVQNNAWDVAADGQRILMAVPVQTQRPEPLQVILNWKP
jgi:Tol biopolymer transport system component